MPGVVMKKVFSFFKLLFFSVFATTKMLENVEADWAQLTGENSSRPSTKAVPDNGDQSRQDP